MAPDVIIERPHLFLGSRLKRLAEQFQSEAGQVAQGAGVPIQPGQYPLLITLDEHGPRTVGELAADMRMSQPAITRNAARLVRAGLVAVGRGDPDRRQKVVSLTAAARQALERSRHTVWPQVEAAVKELTDGLSGPLLDQIAAIERRMAERSLRSRAHPASAVEMAPATDADVPAVAALMNRAYRGTGADAGWDNEAGIVEGARTSETLLRQEMAADGDATLLLWRPMPDGDPQGCVWLRPLGDGAWYLGSLTIEPGRQNAGLGRRLLTASESWVRERGGTEIRMTVINVRDRLLAWYERRGYAATGETEPFPYGDDSVGTPTRDDLRFIVLRKPLA